jgi:AbrB family looped-hinge helix DNA binding protein
MAYLSYNTMRMEIVSISSKGQVTIPAHVRRTLRIERGDKLIATVGEEGLLMKPLTYKTLPSLFAAVRSTHYVSDQEVKRIVRQRSLRRYRSCT